MTAIKARCIVAVHLDYERTDKGDEVLYGRIEIDGAPHFIVQCSHIALARKELAEWVSDTVHHKVLMFQREGSDAKTQG